MFFFRSTRSAALATIVIVSIVVVVIGLSFARLPVSRVFVAFVPIVFFGVPVMSYLARRFGGRRAGAAADEKPKRGESLEELLALLNDDDLDDLRRRVKARLEDHVADGSPEEVAAFDDLLAEAKRRRARGDRQ